MLTLLVPQDPWLRNEVWRFDRRQFGMADRPVLIRRLLSRGVVPGFSLAVVTAGAGMTEDTGNQLIHYIFHYISGIHYYFESKNEHAHH